jgi:hypothetical protein
MDKEFGLPNNSCKVYNQCSWVRAPLCKLQKGSNRLAGASDKVDQLLAHGRWFSPASSTTKIGRHAITEILLKVALSTKNQPSSKTKIHQAEHRFNREAYRPYTGAAGMLRYINVENSQREN